MSAASVLGHAGGWDEAGFVALPIALFGGLLAVANRRAAAQDRKAAQPPTSEVDENVTATDAQPDDPRG